MLSRAEVVLRHCKKMLAVVSHQDSPYVNHLKDGKLPSGMEFEDYALFVCKGIYKMIQEEQLRSKNNKTPPPPQEIEGDDDNDIEQVSSPSPVILCAPMPSQYLPPGFIVFLLLGPIVQEGMEQFRSSLLMTGDVPDICMKWRDHRDRKVARVATMPRANASVVTNGELLVIQQLKFSAITEVKLMKADHKKAWDHYMGITELQLKAEQVQQKLDQHWKKIIQFNITDSDHPWMEELTTLREKLDEVNAAYLEEVRRSKFLTMPQRLNEQAAESDRMMSGMCTPANVFCRIAARWPQLPARLLHLSSQLLRNEFVARVPRMICAAIRSVFLENAVVMPNLTNAYFVVTRAMVSTVKQWSASSTMMVSKRCIVRTHA